MILLMIIALFVFSVKESMLGVVSWTLAAMVSLPKAVSFTGQC